MKKFLQVFLPLILGIATFLFGVLFLVQPALQLAEPIFIGVTPIIFICFAMLGWLFYSAKPEAKKWLKALHQVYATALPVLILVLVGLGTAKAQCTINVVSATPSACANNTYNLDVVVSYSNSPGGNITVNTHLGNTITVAATTSPQTITLTGIQANAYNNVDVTAFFVSDPACTATLVDAYNAPPGCWACGSNLLLNPSFEIDALNTSPPSNWVGNGQVAGNNMNEPDGTKYAFATFPGTHLYQDVAANVGSIYTLNFYSGAHVPSVQTVTIQFLDATSTPIGAPVVHNVVYDTDVTSPQILGGPYTLVSGAAPSNAAFIRIRMDNNNMDFVKVDALCLTEMPSGSCTIDVASATPSACVPATNTYSLDVVVTYSNSPGGNITVNTSNGGTITVAATTSPQTITLTGLTADGVQNIDVTAFFVNDNTCTDDLVDAYDAPAPCPPCTMTVTSATPTACSNNLYDLAVVVNYSNFPGGNITVNTSNGGTITVAATTSPQTITLTGLTADGVTGIDVTAFFVNDNACTDDLTDAYDAPAPCPPCTMTVTSATPTACSNNLYDLAVVVNYTNSPGGNITVNTSNGGTITVAATTSPQTITLTGLSANGVQDIDVTAFFVNDNACTDDLVDAYDAPASCACPDPFPLCPGETYTLTAEAGYINYQWFLDTGSGPVAIPGANMQIYATAGTIGTYTWTATDASNCPVSACCPIVLEEGNCLMPDYGDLPAPYNTSSGSGGPSHIIIDGLFLGSSIDDETDGQPSGNADADGVDEDGVTFPPIYAGTTANITVNATNSTGGDAKLYGFIDWNYDGTFDDAGEMVMVTIPDGSAGNFVLAFAVPSGATTAQLLGARFRLGTETNLGPDGPAIDGEIEDYMISICDVVVTLVSQVNVSCNGENDGSVDITVTSFNGGPYTYDWSNDGPEDPDDDIADVNLLPAGTYTVTVTDAGGCTNTVSVTITEPPLLTVTISNIVNADCAGGDDGSATATATGGTSPYDYAWSYGFTETDITGASNASGLAAGGYNVTVTDANGCTAVAAFEIADPTGVTLVVSNITNETCDESNDGTAKVTANGGTSPYDFAWSNGQSALDVAGPDAMHTATGLAAGTYLVTVTDANGCIAIQTIVVTQPTNLVVQVVSTTNETCTAANDGTATVTATGGITPYTYDWSNDGAEAPDNDAATVTGLAAGTYTVTVTDANLCTATITVTITEPTALSVSIAPASVINPTCNGMLNGSATATPTGGTPSYTYLWSNGSADQTPTNLGAGTYTVTVTDANGCQATTSVTLTQPAVLTNVISDIVNADCAGGDDGSATATASGGTGPYDFAWSYGFTELNVASSNATGLAAGGYNVTVTDANGCTVVTAFEISDPTGVTLVVSQITNETCDESNDGTTKVTANGGTSPYDFVWSNGQSALDVAGPDAMHTATGLAAGTYLVTATDANGCSAIQTVVITQPTNLVAQIVASSPEGCVGNNDGSATVNATGGITPYTYDWSNNGAQNPDTDTDTATGLAAGTYTVTVTDANGCTATATVVITNVEPLVLDVTSLNENQCGHADGSIELTASGGTTPYTYDWSNDGAETPDNDQDDLSGLAAGTYTVTVTDARGCTATVSVTITCTEPASIGNYTWIDANANGIQDPGESPLPGVLVILTGVDVNGNGVNLSEATDGTGNYLFDDLMPGTYKLTFITPTGGYVLTEPNTGADDVDSDADGTMGGMTVNEVLLANEDNLDYDAGYYIPASIGNFAWVDDNANGIQDPGEPGLEGVQVMLIGTDGLGNAVMETVYTDVNGAYLFDNLVPGTYKLKFVSPTGSAYELTGNDLGGDDTQDSDAIESMGGMTAFEELTSGENNMTYDAGFYEPASLGDYVWLDENANGVQDAGEPGIEDVEVKLQDAAGNPVTVDADGNPIVNQFTDATGFYEFTNLIPGTYKVMFINPDPTRYELTLPNAGTDDAQDSDATPAMLMTDITVLGSGDNDPTLDAGFYVPAKVGDFVWNDLNGNGIQDGGEPGIEGAEVTLTGTDGQGNLVNLTVFTDATGMYMFGDLVPGTYKLTFEAPVGSTFMITAPNEGTDEAADSDADPSNMNMTDPFTLVSGDTIPTFDAGFLEPAKLGDTVWVDANANGIQDAGEAPLADVVVVLTGTDGAGNAVNQTVTTDATGMYMFSNLLPGTYTVTFVTPTGGYVPTSNDEGGDDAVDSDGDEITGSAPPVVLMSGDTVLTIDMGYYIPASIGNFAWVDDNANGIQDPGEPGLEGVQVMLIGTDGLGNAVMETVYTDVNGAYLFDNLVPGTYKLKFVSPTGSAYELTGNDLGGDDTQDSDAIESMGGMTAFEELTSGENNMTYDAGFYEPASLGDYVWLDENANGVQDAGEPGIEDVEVKLQDAAGNPVTVDADGNPIVNQFTDATGFYEFTNLIPGTYKVMFINPDPTRYELTLPNAGTDDAQDSDATPAMLMTDITVLGSGDNDPTLDAGFYVPAKVGDFVWNDLNGNGIQDGGEPGIEGAEVTLTGTDGQGNIVNLTVFTDATGMYMFGDLVPGTYKLTFEAPAGSTYMITAPNEGTDEAADSDADPSNMNMTDPFTLVSGDTIPTFDAGFLEPAKLGDTVWVDANANGIQDAGEAPLADVVVVLTGTDGAGNAVNQTVTTDATGMYMFSNLLPGTYTVTFVTPTGGYVPTSNDEGGDDAVDSDGDEITGSAPAVVLMSGDTVLTIDMGYYIPASIGNFAWVDDNANGIQDPGEPGLEGVQVMLIGTDGLGNAVMETVYTDVNGAYLFDNLVPGTYKLKFVSPTGSAYELTGNDLGGDDTQDSDAIESMGGMTAFEELTSGENNMTYDAGFYEPASLGDYVWLDENANGVQDAGEPGIEDVEVKLQDAAGNPVTVDADGNPIVNQFTDATGFYEFTNLIPGTYKVMFINPDPTRYELTIPNAGTDDAQDSDATPAMLMTDITVLGSGDNDPTLDAGFYVPAKVGDFVWNDLNGNGIQDGGEPGIEGAEVTLTGTDGQGNIVNLTVFTDATGMYMFGDLVPGTYKLTFEAPAGSTYMITAPNEGTDEAADSDADPSNMNMTDPFTLVSGDTIPTFDAGFLEPAKLGDTVWVDANANGIQDAGEAPLADVVVVLTGTDGAGNAVNQTVTTDATGMYMFSNLLPGTYTVTFVTPTGGYVPTSNDEGGDDAVDSDGDEITGSAPAVVLMSGDTVLTIDMGYYIPASIGNFAWVDDNANGIQDPGEPGLEGVQVMLIGTDGLGNAVMETVYTDVNGAYLFDNLVPGTYKLKFVSPTGSAYELTGNDLGGDDTQDSDAIESMGGMTAFEELTSGENNMTYDAGFYEPASLGDYVWLDENANGVQDAGEPGIEGVEVKLQDAAGNPVTVDADGNPIVNQFTDATGFYEFTNLIPGTYKVMFINPDPTRYELTIPNAGTDDAQDSDATPAMLMTDITVLGSGDNDPTLDAGFYVPAKVGDFVWNDLNGNGIQDGGEPGIEGAEVTLTGTDGQGNIVNLTVFTDATGMYMFGDLVPGTYKLTFEAPAGSDFVLTDPNEGTDEALDSDADPSNMNMTDPFTLVSGDTIPTFDAGFLEPAKLGDTVWVDANANGIQDAGEAPLADVVVVLTGTDGAGNAVNQTVTTDATGMYMFSNLLPGTYTVTFVTPTGGYVPTSNDEGGDDAVDSDGDEITGSAPAVVLMSGDTVLTIDMGYYIPASIGNFAWVDDNANGIQDPGEPGLEGVQVMLIGTDGLGNAVMETVYTDVNGAYLFDNLVPGTYKLKFVSPTGSAYELTGNDLGGDDTQDSDAIESMGGMTAFEELTSGENNMTYDAGFYEPASLGDYVWLDENANGVQDAGEPGIEDVEVKLQDAAGNPVTVDADGNPIVNQFTDATGFYEFTNLIPGTYKVMFINPDPTRYELTIPNAGTDDAQDSDATPAMLMTDITVLGSGDNDPTLDAGFYVPAKVGDFVWNDLNGNGIQDGGEAGIEGAEVTLTGTDGQGNIVNLTVFTDATGMYMFGDLVPGTYKLTFEAPAGSDFVLTDPNEGTDEALDSDADPSNMGMTEIFTLVSGDTIPTFDAGYYLPAEIGNYTWIDSNADGDQDAGELPLPGVLVVLTGTTGSGEAVNMSMLTDANGLYLFEDLQPGTYKLTFQTPIGDWISTTPNDPDAADDTVDSDADPAMGGMTILEVLVSGESNLTYDAGYYEPASIGDFVWSDLDADGIQDTGEPGIVDALVTLTGTNGQGEAINLTTMTDANGYYLFDDLMPGTYKLTFSTPAGFDFTSPLDSGADDTIDSDADATMGGMTVFEVLTSGEHNPTYDAGFYQCPEIFVTGLPLMPVCPDAEIPAILIKTVPGATTISWTGGSSIGMPDGSGPGDWIEIPAFTATAEGSPTITVTATLGECVVTYEFVIVVEDETPPFFEDCPTEPLVFGTDPDQCSAYVNWPQPVAEDNCELDITVTQTTGPLSGTIVEATCPPAPITITYVADDHNGNTASCEFTILVVDTQIPEFDADIVMPNDTTVNCHEVPTNCVYHGPLICTPLTNADVHDNCTAPADLDVEFLEESTQCADPAECCYYTYDLTRTWTVTDCSANELVHTQMIHVQDTTAPVALCKDATIALDKTGQIVVVPADIDNGSYDNCAEFPYLTFAVNPNTFTCANLGPNLVTLSVTDPCGNVGTCQAIVTIVEGIAPCTPQIDVETTCMGMGGMGNATTMDNGQFMDLITIKSLAMQTWRLASNSTNNGKGFYSITSSAPPANPTLLPVGTLFTAGTADGIDNDGDGATDEADEMIYYTLKGLHVDCQGYDITASNTGGIGLGTGATTIHVENKACYPNPYFNNLLEDTYCLGTPPFLITVGEYNNAAGSVVPGSIMIDGVPTDLFDPNALGLGSHTIMATFDAGIATTNLVIDGVQIGGTMADAVADPGCKQKITKIIHIVETPTTLNCNDLVHVSMDEDCKVTLTADDVLEGTYYCYDDYLVEVDKTQPMGNGPWVMAMFDASDIGKTYFYHVVHISGGPNVCWGEIKIEDKLMPDLTCPADITIACSESTEPSHTGNVVVKDCSTYTTVIDDEYTDFGQCSDPRGQLVRTWIVTDAWGNQNSCSQVITIVPFDLDDVVFPIDVTVDCETAYLNNSAIAPDVTGRPSINGFPIGQGGLCTASINYSDERFDICPGSYEILRTWKVRNTCFPIGPDNPITHVQVITVSDLGGPTFACPPSVVVSTDAFSCCSTAALPDMLISEGCSHIIDLEAKVTGVDPANGNIITFTVGGHLEDFAGNNYWNPDTMAVFDYTQCVPLGTYQVRYKASDECGNTSYCFFDLTVADLVPPVASCDQTTTVAVTGDDPSDCYTPADGCEGAGVAWEKATSFNDGSYDNCHQVKFTVRRMAPYSDCINNLSHDPCYPNGMSEYDLATAELDSLKFYCCEVGSTQTVILRVYQVDLNGNFVPGVDGEPLYNECMVQLEVQDKVKPVCQAPANVTTTCEAFDPSLWLYGKAEVLDNCCLDTTKVYQEQCGLTHTVSYTQFDTLCNKGTITRTFRAFDCHGQSSQCTQRIVVTYEQDYYVRFPNDVIVTVCDGTGNYGEPTFYGEDCELLAVSFTDEIFTVVPDACFKIERTWNVINWCTYNPNLTPLCIDVPNPNPNATTNHPTNLPGPIVSPIQTVGDPWKSTIVKVLPSDAQATNYSIYYNANANCYRYKQIIKIIDTQDPVAQCPASPVTVCDLTANDAQLWNASYWWDNGNQSHDLCEAPSDICLTATDACSGANINFEYQLFLDLDNDGVMETVVNSTQLGTGQLGWNNILYGNVTGAGQPRQFDDRPVPANQKWGFAIQETVTGTDKTACVKFNTFQNQSGYVTPQLPLGTHKIKWFVTDGCGNETVCEYTIIVKDCKAPTVVCLNGLSVNIMPTGMIAMWATDFLQYSDDNCTQTPYIKFGIRKCDQGTGFPVDANGNPITSVTFTCDELGMQCVELWAIDLAGNADFCKTFILVQDNAGNCNNSVVNVSGVLKTEIEDGVEEANVVITGAVGANPPFSYSDMSDDTGLYEVLGSVPTSADITITPVKDDNPLNGVTTYDLVLMSKHILGIEPLGSPYQMIAADANKSGSITTSDIVELRKLILGIYTDLPNNTSWRFVDKAYVFPDTLNPFANVFPENISIANAITNQFGEDFVGVKIGDVNNTVVANSLMQADDRTNGTLVLDVDDREVKAGEEFELRFSASEQSQGYQFTLNLMGLELVDVLEGERVNSNNFGVHRDEKALTVSIDGANEFTLKLRAAKAGKLSRMLGMSGRITKAEAYSLSGDRMNLALRFDHNTVTGVGFELYQNQPNPFVNKTSISFHLPQAAKAKLTVYDETGRIVFTQKGEFAKGYNTFVIDRQLINNTGALWYRVETDTDSASRTMIQTK